MKRITLLLSLAFIFLQCHTQMNSKDKKANRLIHESSPYLLQHAYNPVDWYPWGEEALEKAKKEDKLLIISIGYAACHWCHVMEHESFEDSLVAKVMNDNFISIKVDREERPDVDDVYMTAAQLLTGRGGWPLNAIALPNGKPVFAGTYYPKEQWLEILNQIIDIKSNNPGRLEDSANKITEGISSTTLIDVNTNDLNLKATDFKDMLEYSFNQYDTVYGGRIGAPKFPMPNSYEFLMKYYWLSKDQKAYNIIKTGLDNMAKGGIFDQLGGGFARYSVDAYWLVPHFEKMLYDNAQLISVYSQFYKITKDDFYKRVVEETINFANRELGSPTGAYYSSLDADSEGEEGKFYVWEKSQIFEILTDELQANLFCEYYDVTDAGNWEHKNILNIKNSKEELCKKHNITTEKFDTLISQAKKLLLEVRNERIRPGLDDKILTSWNALMISGLVDAYNATGHKNHLNSAVKCANFLKEKQTSKEGRLNRNFKDDKSSINAFLDDYALTIKAYIELYQATFQKEWLDEADKLMKYCIEHFYNNELKMFDYTSKLDPPLIAKKLEYEDNVIPSSNSAAARALFELGTLLYNELYLEMSEQMMKNMIPRMGTNNFINFYSNWYQLLFDILVPPFEVAIIGHDADNINHGLQMEYLGNSLFLGSHEEENLELLKEKYQDGLTMIYVCQNKTCKLPVTEKEDALPLIVHQFK